MRTDDDIATKSAENNPDQGDLGSPGRDKTPQPNGADPEAVVFGSFGPQSKRPDPPPPPLALEPRILDRMVEELERAGLVGEERGAKLVYLLLTSRLFDRPLCASIKGQSSAGKNTVVERVLALFPPTAYLVYTSMSVKFIAYDTEPLAHRIVVIMEAAGLGSGEGAYLMRSLISEGRIRHGTVQSTAEGHSAQTIEREGPAGLLVTTTALRLEPEIETRMLSIPIDDSPSQTSAILMAYAAHCDGSGNVVPLDPAPWYALQRWLERGEQRVVLPFAKRVARSILPVAVRLRRDFPSIIGLITAHALLHRAQRNRDGQGRIIATRDDYAAVYELVADLMSEGVGAKVSKEVRETVEAVRALAPGAGAHTSYPDLAKSLKRDRTTVVRRVAEAIRLGYLQNLEERSRQPAMIMIGETMPDGAEIMLHPSRLVH